MLGNEREPLRIDFKKKTKIAQKKEYTPPEWMSRFPLPQSLDDEEFFVWGRSLDIKSQKKIVDEICEWDRNDIANRRPFKPTGCENLVGKDGTLLPGHPMYDVWEDILAVLNEGCLEEPVSTVPGTAGSAKILPFPKK